MYDYIEFKVIVSASSSVALCFIAYFYDQIKHLKISPVTVCARSPAHVDALNRPVECDRHRAVSPSTPDCQVACSLFATV